MKTKSLLLVAILLAVFASHSFLISDADARSKKLSDRDIAKKVIKTHSEFRIRINELSLPDDVRSKIINNRECYRSMPQIFNNEEVAKEYYRWYLYSFMLISSWDGEQGLLTLSGTKMSVVGKQLLQRASSKRGKALARSLIAHGEYAGLYVYPYSLDFCSIAQRVEDLGGYSNERAMQALDEAVRSRPGARGWSYDIRPKGSSLDSRILSGSAALYQLKFSSNIYNNYIVRMPWIFYDKYKGICGC